ncbi:MAG: zf-HC2 domain-containing protein [Endomicrobiia bacterium]|nr:zf-HC2 domain-containing protein [Endomicrobiia bacterium]
MKHSKCNFDERLISACVDSETTPEETEKVKEHVRLCERCRSDYFAYVSARATFLSVNGFPTVYEPAPNTLWRSIKRKIAAASSEPTFDIFERYFYKLTLAAGMLLYLSADTFSPEVTMLFGLYFGFHLYIYSDKFDYRRKMLDA